MISPEAPYPLDGGGALRTASLLQYLGARYELDLIVFQHPGQKTLEALPSGLVRRAQAVPLHPHRGDFAARAARNGMRILKGRPPLVDRFGGYDAEIEALIGSRTYDLAVLEHFWSASYIPLIKRFARRVVLDLHNIESEWHAGCARASAFPGSIMHRAFAAAARREEKQWMPECDLALATSEEDARRVRGLAPSLPVCVYPNAIPWREPLERTPDQAIAFSGNLEYEPNRSGLRWFLKRVWPALKLHFPALVFRVIGKNAHAIAGDVRGMEGVECTGWVQDPFPHLASAQICIAPLRSGSGTRLKIVEAWAAQRAVVSTRVGAEGLEGVDGDSIVLADTPEFFTTSIARLLIDKELRQKIANSGRELFERKYTWNVAWNTLSRRLED